MNFTDQKLQEQQEQGAESSEKVNMADKRQVELTEWGKGPVNRIKGKNLEIKTTILMKYRGSLRNLCVCVALAVLELVL